jgi:hypothetical protein
MTQQFCCWAHSQKTWNLYVRGICAAMLIVALFPLSTVWNQLTCPSTDEWIKRLVCVYNRILFNLKKKEILSLATTCMKQEDIILSEINQIHNDKSCMILLICRTWKSWTQKYRNSNSDSRYWEEVICLGTCWSKDTCFQLDKRSKFKRSLYSMIPMVNNSIFEHF